jgi:hypothetical protein
VALATGLFAGVGGCSGVWVQERPTAAPAFRYRTFTLQQGVVQSVGLASEAHAFRDRLDEHLRRQLRDRGLEESQRKPDLVVVYTATERVTSPIERFTGSEPHEGGLTVQLVDSDQQKVVWQSTAQAGGQDLDKLAKAMVDRALRVSPPEG